LVPLEWDALDEAAANIQQKSGGNEPVAEFSDVHHGASDSAFSVMQTAQM
jgi:hypothetical protein